ncbi:MAG: alanine--tRNA ligase [Bacteroidales bacterium]|nr:alanine--tRNA ligase [Bacteroidales bacterium]
MMTSKEIRSKFLEFFASKGHQIVPSAPMVVKGDPTLMFTNAGMNQFKDWFLGNSEIKYPRVADSQKCLRVSGKHNDLEEVGHDTYHHTMFEMLGNWSFGDYFKEEAIDWAWELLTEVYKLDPNRLYATIFEGNPEEGVSLDNEAKTYWLKHLPEERIILGNKKDNFWEMGETGPCGPCSEIHIDLRSDEERAALPGVALVNQGHHLVIEIWNLVFIQYNRKANGSLEPLPKKHVDTGMGLERLVMAINGFKSNYEGDLFQHLIAEISKLSGCQYTASEDIAVAMRVIADHIRAISFSIADGQLPSNVKAGYVIRRILRRAVRYAYTFLGVNTPFLCRLVPALIREMGEAYPELQQQQTLIERVIKEEEEAFLRTLEKGIRLMDQMLEKAKDSKIISGEDAFTLYDTFGFPIDLSELIAKEKGYSIDLEGFEKELGKQKERARNAAAVEESDWIEILPEQTSSFIGYDATEADVRILKYRTIKSRNKELIQVVLDQSPFYAESGGQAGDSGTLTCGNETIHISNTIKENNLNIHLADRIPADPTAIFHASINLERRQDTTNNHSATHLLHYALRELIGTHIEQKGSSVTAESFRFDFSHYEKIGPEKLREVERRVNQLIRQNIRKEEFRDLPIEEARNLGAMALFGEKYGDHVRVIRFGKSAELCGGTHVDATGNIGYFRILSESAVAAGVRRIEAVTGRQAELSIEIMADQAQTIRELFGQSPNLVQSIKKLFGENENYRKAFEEVNRERVQNLKKTVQENATVINGITVYRLQIGTYMPDIIKDLAFQLHKDSTRAIFAAAFRSGEDKPSLVLMYSDDLVAEGKDASKDIKLAARFVQGGGGGQKFLATAGGKVTEGLSQALETLIDNAVKA